MGLTDRISIGILKEALLQGKCTGNHQQRNERNENVSKDDFFLSNNYDDDNNIWGSNW